MILVNDKTGVTQLLKAHNATSRKSDSTPLLDIRAAAKRLSCSERFVRRLVQERRIPFVKLGGTRVRFLDSDLEHWIDGQRINANR